MGKTKRRTRKESAKQKSDTYDMEEIVGKRTLEDGTVQYRIKWKDYPHSRNTWEPVDNIYFKGYIEDFENAAKERERNRINIPHSQYELIKYPEHFKAEKIMGISIIDSQKAFLIKWQNFDRVDFVACEEANKKCPELIIEYFEGIIEWVKN